jgi:hypothetical protein
LFPCLPGFHATGRCSLRRAAAHRSMVQAGARVRNAYPVTFDMKD